ncbi:MAG: hypothetical protein ACREQO_19890 [Candidatus Binatia bacterium]
MAGRRSFIEKKSRRGEAFYSRCFEGIRTIYLDKELSLKVLARYTKVNDEKILDESCRFGSKH